VSLTRYCYQPVKKTATFISRHTHTHLYMYISHADPRRAYHIISYTTDNSEITGQLAETTVHYDYLVYAVRAEAQTFSIKGIREHACFMKELADAERVSFVVVVVVVCVFLGARWMDTRADFWL